LRIIGLIVGGRVYRAWIETPFTDLAVDPRCAHDFRSRQNARWQTADFKDKLPPDRYLEAGGIVDCDQE